jgi:predicted histidine transporter YuiF (NhaC family)
MLLHLDRIPRLHNILAAVFTWILLAGFLVIPGTFTSFKNSEAFKDSNNKDALEQKILHSVANVGLLWVSGACFVIGLLGCCWLWFMWRRNYVWLINRIFLYDQFPLQSRMC